MRILNVCSPPLSRAQTFGLEETPFAGMARPTVEHKRAWTLFRQPRA